MVTLPFLLPVKFIHNVRLSSYLINTIMGLIRLVVSVVFHTSPEKPSQYLKIQKPRLNFIWWYSVYRYLQLVVERKMLPMCMDCACSFCKLYILICPHRLWVVSAVFSQGQHVVPPRCAMNNKMDKMLIFLEINGDSKKMENFTEVINVTFESAQGSTFQTVDKQFFWEHLTCIASRFNLAFRWTASISPTAKPICNDLNARKYRIKDFFNVGKIVVSLELCIQTDFIHIIYVSIWPYQKIHQQYRHQQYK